MNEKEKKHVLFIRGGGGEASYKADARLVASLRTCLGSCYLVHYPDMPGNSALSSEWMRQVDKEIAAINGEMILVGHSFGGSVLLKFLSENRINKKVVGIFIVAAPFWGDGGWQFKGIKNGNIILMWIRNQFENSFIALSKNFARKLPRKVPIFLYHNSDDIDVPFSHLALYAARLPQAIIFEGTSGGHQFDDNLSQVAKDILSLQDRRLIANTQ